MGGDGLLGIKLAAFAAAMKAKAGELSIEDVDALGRMVGDLIIDSDVNHDHPVLGAVADFVYDCNVYMRDVVKLAEIGADLCHHIETLNVPEPPDLDRRDIYG